MTFDDQAIEAALAAHHATPPHRDMGFRAMQNAISAALASMKSRGIDPCADARKAERERCAKVAEGPMYKEHYRGTEYNNWTIDGSNRYGNGRMDAASEIRALEDE
jgi:hypothetical protein